MENDNNRPGSTEPAPQSRWFNTAIALSVLLHLALVVAIAPTRLGTTSPPALVDQQPVLVMLRRRDVREPAVQEAQEVPASEAPASPSGQPPTADAVPAEQPALPLPPAPPGNVVAVMPPRERLAIPGQDATATNNTPATLDAGTLAATIRGQMQNYRGEQQIEWMEDCQRFRNRYFTQDCTQDPARRSGSGQIPDTLVVPLLDDDSVLGELARERYALTASPRNFHFIMDVEERTLASTIGFSIGSGESMGGDLGLLVVGLLKATGLIVTPLAVPDFTRPGASLASELQQPLQQSLQEPPQQDTTETDTATFKLTPPVFPGNG